jgi:DNA-binding NtrC family response regulator
LLRYCWPGNVRQLRSVIQRGQILCDAQEICPKDPTPARAPTRSHLAPRRR